jgi:glycerol uptake facilitator-like aquaporin
MADERDDCRGTRIAKEFLMHSPWFGEFLGTLVLVLLGNGVNAGVILR